MLSEQYSIQPASVEHAGAIYDLKVDVFGERYLQFMIYQAAQSVEYLRQLLVNAGTHSPHSLFMYGSPERILGYYHALQRYDEYFLNDIVVVPSAQGQGVGRALFDHFEARGRQLGCRRFGLDVFDSNQRAIDWYEGLGYRPGSSSFTAILPLQAWLQVGTPPLICDMEAWAEARREEAWRGFSKITFICGKGRLVVGLIAGHLCNLLDREGFEVEEAIGAIARTFHPERSSILVPSLASVPSSWPVSAQERILRLCKEA